MKIIAPGGRSKNLRGNILLPASKSLSNRALIIQTLSGDNLQIRNLSKADDTVLMLRLLQVIREQYKNSTTIELDCGNAGTVFRFLTAYLAITPGSWFITGNLRMKQRPIGILVEALNHLDADISYAEKEGFPPLLIRGKKLSGGEITIDSSVSSQFISALLLIAPKLINGLKLTLEGKFASEPYMRMTLVLMQLFGINYNFSEKQILVTHQAYKSNELIIESDWSAAAFFYEIAALSDQAELLLKGLKKESLQGDAVLPELYRSLGVKSEFVGEDLYLTKTMNIKQEFNFDFKDFPDLALPVIATCAGLGITGRFTGLESLRIKESDRIRVLCSELGKLGFDLQQISRSELRTRNLNSKSRITETPAIDPHTDHRVAMALAPLSLINGSLEVDNPEVVTKSFPGFWNELVKLGFQVNY